MTSGLRARCRGGRQLRCLPGSSLGVGRVPTFLTEMGVWWLQDWSPTHGFGSAELGLDGLWPMLRYRLVSSVAAGLVSFVLSASLGCTSSSSGVNAPVFPSCALRPSQGLNKADCSIIAG